MSARDRLKDGVTFFARIEKEQHEALRLMAYEERRTMASLMREAMDLLIETRKTGG